MFELFSNGLLRHPQQSHNPCYRKAICYSYFRVLKEKTVEEAEAMFDKMLENLNSDHFINHKDFLAIYPVIMDEEGGLGYFIVDPARNFFPLVIYPKSHTDFNGEANKTRKAAFETVLRKLQKNRSKIFELLNKYDTWTDELEKNLEKLLEYPKHRRSAANNPIYNNNDFKKTG